MYYVLSCYTDNDFVIYHLNIKTPQVLVSASDCLFRWQPNVATLMENVYMPSRAVCRKVSNCSAMATRIFWCNCCNYFCPQTAKILTSHKGPTWASKTYVAFVYFMKNVQSISTHIHLYWSFWVLYVFKLNTISNIHLIFTFIQMWKYLALSDPCWPFVWG